MTALLFPILLALPVLDAQPAPAPEARDLPAATDLRGMIELYATDRRALLRMHGLSMSEARRTRLSAFHDEWAARLAALDFSALARDAQVDFLLLANRLEYDRRSVQTERASCDEQRPLVPFAQHIVALQEARRRMEPLDAREAAEALVALEAAIGEARARVQRELGAGTPPKPTLANRAAGTVRELRGALAGWFRSREGYDPLFDWWVREPYGAAEAALDGYARFLREEVAGLRAGDEDAIIGDPIGRAALLSELEYAMIPYSPEELVEIAEREFAWCDAEMLRASRELGYGDDWRAALEHVKDQFVPPGQQPALIREQALEAVAFLEEHELVTIPELCKDLWRIEMMSPQRQKVNPFFTGGEVISVSFPTAGMAHADKLMSLRSNNVHFCRATVHHELIPGHHLQGYMADRHRTYRRLFGTPFYLEGWALYWEMVLWDLDFQRSAEDRIGMLFWRSHRCARIIASLGFHLETMTTDEMITFLVERVGHERSSAEGEVRRWVGGGYGPLYQAAYMLGGLQLRALKRQLVDSGEMGIKEFHDAVLRENSIPIDLIRASLTNKELQPGYKSDWRFYPLED
jgi:uncharacterized protein (DUF885 family)